MVSLELVCERVESILSAGHQHEVTAARREGVGEGLANARAGTGHQGS
jgi:hypothetical protein